MMEKYNLVTARLVSEKGIYTSDISDYEEINKKRKAKKKVISSSEDESEQEINIPVPPVPKVFSMKQRERRETSVQKEGFSQKEREQRFETCERNEGFSQKQRDQCSESFGRNESISQKQREQCSGSSERNEVSLQDAGTLWGLSSRQSEGSYQDPTHKQFQHQVLRQLNVLSLKLDNLSADLMNIFKIVNRTATPEEPGENQFVYNFPLENVEELMTFETYLDNSGNYKNFVKYIQRIGGNTEYEAVKRLYSRILTNDLAESYNWLGLKNKNCFKDLTLAKATVEALLKNEKFSSEKTVEAAVKNWLRHAKERREKVKEKGKDKEDK